MPPLIQDLAQLSLKEKGLEGLSFTMPVSTRKWVDDSGATPAVTFTASSLSLQCSSHNWLAPFPGRVLLTNTSDKKIPLTLQKADGAVVNEAGVLLKLFPQAILRMRRLLAIKAETDNAHSPLRGQGISVRQVPAFAFIPNTTGATPSQGLIHTGEDLGLSGELLFFDEQGYILHPLYVASLTKTLLALYPILQLDGSLPDQLSHIIGLQTGTSKSVRLVKPDGTPHSGDRIQGITVLEAGAGFFSLNAPGGSDTSLLGQVSRAAATAEDGAFPPHRARQILIGNVCYGRFLDQVSLPSQASTLGTNQIVHDFFTLQVIDLQTYLTGTPAPALPSTELEPRPSVRLNEVVHLLNTGNALMGRFSTIFGGSPADSLIVAPKIDEHLPLPADATAVLWPDFPALPTGFTAEPGEVPLPSTLREELQTHGRADFVQRTEGGQPVDILLRLTGLPRGCYVRVFNRRFEADAVIKRGDGAGGVCSREVPAIVGRTFNGELDLLLTDPLGLVRPDGTTTVPDEPHLIADVVIVRQNKQQKRFFGALIFPVQTPAVAPPAAPPFNALQGVMKKGVSRAAILGLHQTSITAIDFSSFESILNMVLTYLGETQPRDAPRLPTMARRDLLAAARKTTGWEAVVGAGRIDGRMHHAEQELASPGSPGGPESATLGAYTQQGQLAYDVGRAAFRRTTSFYERLLPLSSADWNEPAARDPLGTADTPTASQGLFAAALLQNIAPYCETPELALLKSVVSSNVSNIPDNFDDLVDLVVGWINGIDLTGLPSPLDDGADKLRTELVSTLNNLKDNNALAESDKERLYNEVKRELSTSCFGRRDSQWALQQAIGQARHFLYIETPGFSITEGINAADHNIDLEQLLKNRMQNVPGLKVIICVPKQPDYQPAYAQWIAKEVKTRYELLQTFPASQVVVFHPIGFPGRPSNIEHQLVIADDQWALLGSSAWRRRGMSFDGSSDLVFTELERRHGISESIAAFRRSVMAQRLGIDLADSNSSRMLQLNYFPAAFNLVRQMLQAGGLGKLERLWNGRTQGVPYSEPTISEALANPDGQKFNALEATVFSAFASLPK